MAVVKSQNSGMEDLSSVPVADTCYLCHYGLRCCVLHPRGVSTPFSLTISVKAGKAKHSLSLFMQPRLPRDMVLANER